MPESYSPEELMIVSAARRLGRLASAGHPVCFVGIGLPSAAANLARKLYSPPPVLVYESGCIGSKPSNLPLSIGDGELAETADSLISIPETFAYWLQAGRIDVGFLGGAQIDKFANINSTVIGNYDNPTTRLPGAGGAPEIAASAKQVMVIMRQSVRSFVERCDFRTSVGHGSGPGDRQRFGLLGEGPRWVITDLGILEPDPSSCELTMVAVQPGVTRDQVSSATGWALKFAESVVTIDPPSSSELQALRQLEMA